MRGRRANARLLLDLPCSESGNPFRMRYYFLVFILLFIGFSACKRINAPRPPCKGEYLEIQQDTSYLSTPLVIPTRLIEEKLNRAIGEDIVDDDDFENINKKGKRDKLKLKVSRLGDIQVQWKDNVATYQAPILVLAQRQIVSKRMLSMSKSIALKTEFSLRLVLETTVDIGEDWKLQPKTKFVSFKWLSEVKTLGGLIDVKKMVERRLHSQMPQILVNIDSTIRAKVHLDRAITRVWQNIQKPMIINRKEQVVWLKINPIRFELGTITTDSGNLLIQGRLSATTETLVGDSPAYTVDSILPPLVKRRELPDTAFVYMLSEISYKDINAVVSRKLAGQVFKLSGHRIKIKGVEIWGCGANLVLHLSVLGSVHGDIYLQGMPRYERDSQRIVIQNFDFEVRTQETLLASADWLLHGTFKEEIKDALRLPLAEKIDSIPEIIMRGIERGRVGKKMDFMIEQWDFRPRKIWVRPFDIAALVTVNAQVRVELQQI